MKSPEQEKLSVARKLKKLRIYMALATLSTVATCIYPTFGHSDFIFWSLVVSNFFLIIQSGRADYAYEREYYWGL